MSIFSIDFSDVSKITIGDIDIDCKNRNDILNIIKFVPAKRTDGTKHLTGIYVQDIEFDPRTGLAEQFFEESDFTKIDLLNLSFLSYFTSNDEITKLIEREPNWDLLKIPEVVKSLPQIHRHFDLIQRINPTSIDDLVFILKKIRETAQYSFKTSHSYAYALNIVALLNYFELTNTIPKNIR